MYSIYIIRSKRSSYLPTCSVVTLVNFLNTQRLNFTFVGQTGNQKLES